MISSLKQFIQSRLCYCTESKYCLRLRMAMDCTLKKPNFSKCQDMQCFQVSVHSKLFKWAVSENRWEQNGGFQFVTPLMYWQKHRDYLTTCVFVLAVATNLEKFSAGGQRGESCIFWILHLSAGINLDVTVAEILAFCSVCGGRFTHSRTRNNVEKKIMTFWSMIGHLLSNWKFKIYKDF